MDITTTVENDPVTVVTLRLSAQDLDTLLVGLDTVTDYATLGDNRPFEEVAESSARYAEVEVTPKEAEEALRSLYTAVADAAEPSDDE